MTLRIPKLRPAIGKTIASLFLIAAVLLPGAASGEPVARWLLILDTSYSMRNRAPNAQVAIHDLLASGMYGQIANGDTLGVWTFNDELHTGEVPLQTWSARESGQIADRTSQFLGSRRYEKSTAMDVMLKEMIGVIRASDLITVLIVSDADDQIKGTPFDAKINEAYKRHSREQKKLKMPFVTVLRGEHGIITAYTVNMAQWPVEIPAIKREPPKPPQPKPVAKPAPTLPPLIITGKKPEPAVVPQPLPAATPTVPTPAPVAPATPSVQVAPPPQAEAAPVTPQVEVKKLETPPLASASSLSSQSVPVAEQNLAVAPVKPTPTTPESTAPTQLVQKAPVVSEQEKSPAKSPSPEAALATAPQGFFSNRNILIALIAIGVIGIAILFMLIRRSRAPHTSLITSSLNRDKK